MIAAWQVEVNLELKRAIAQRSNQIIRLNKLNYNNQIKPKAVEKPKEQPKPSYDEVAKTIDALPFPISSAHRNLVAWHYRRIGRVRFLQIAAAAMKNALDPERYFMVCLKREK